MTVPAGYPRELEASIHLADGTALTIRPILPTDADEMEAAYRAADAETLRHRFFTAAPHIGAKQIHYLADVDYDRRLALVAFSDGGEGVGIARYEGLGDPDTAEVAVVVHSDWRRRGIATELLRRLEAPARQRGIEEFEAVYLPENDAVAGVFDRIGYSPPVLEDGLVRVRKRIG